MKKFLLTLCLFSMTSHAEWKLLSSFENREVYYNLSLAKKNNQYVTFWSLNDYKKTQTISNKNFLSSVEKMIIDCDSESFDILYVSYYSENMEQGSQVAVFDLQNEPRKWHTIPPRGLVQVKKIIFCSMK